MARCAATDVLRSLHSHLALPKARYPIRRNHHAERPWPRPDLAMIDLSLPKNDGIQVLEAIRADQRFADMPVVVTSSSAAPPARLTETHLRAARYITKPPDLEEFLQIGAALRDILLECPAGRTRR